MTKAEIACNKIRIVNGDNKNLSLSICRIETPYLLIKELVAEACDATVA
jgi:hypothetical protein